VFREIDKLCELLSNMATKHAKQHGYIVDLNPVVGKRAFWDILSQSKREQKKIQSIDLKLNSPNLNLLNQKARDSLKFLKDTFNSTQVNFEMKNPEEGLDIDENKGELKDYIDYAEEGGGTWELKIEGEGVVKSHSKTAKIKRKIDESNILEFVMEIVDEVRSKYVK
jgi:hypothetical protein